MVRLFQRAAFFTLAVLAVTPTTDAAPPATLTADRATYNPVSIVIREQGLLEKEFAKGSTKDGTKIRWEALRPTLILVTHGVEEAAFLADRVLVMQPQPKGEELAHAIAI